MLLNFKKMKCSLTSEAKYSLASVQRELVTKKTWVHACARDRVMTFDVTLNFLVANHLSNVCHDGFDR